MTEFDAGALKPWIPDPGLEPGAQMGPLARFEGRMPGAPDWFKDAVAAAPERTFVRVDGANIELLTWGQRGKQGLIFVHGNTAHADWWSFVAPLLAEDFRVAALSLSGMGGSDWRAAYSFETFAAEIHACAQAAGLYDAPEKPIFVGHSFGGSQAYYSARRYPERMRAAILVDAGLTSVPPPEMAAQMAARQAAARAAAGDVAVNEGFRHPAERTAPNRVYPTLEAALARFRFMPPQICTNFYIVDFIARRSVRRAPMEGGGEGWTWRFDPFLFGRMDRSAMDDLPETAGAPLVHIYGSRSNVIQRVREGQPSLLPDDIPSFVIPDSDHHVMVDQPLALVAALRGVLATWKPA